MFSPLPELNVDEGDVRNQLWKGFSEFTPLLGGIVGSVVRQYGFDRFEPDTLEEKGNFVAQCSGRMNIGRPAPFRSEPSKITDRLDLASIILC